jgi:ABC-2 type transport system permease protein
VIVTFIALLFVDIQVHNIWVIIATVTLTSATFSLGGLINAIFAGSFDDISIIPTFILTPLTYLGGVFYSISLLPEFWQGVSQLNPIVYMVNAFRYGFLGISDVSLGLSFAVLGVFIISLFLIAMTLITRGVGLRS